MRQQSTRRFHRTIEESCHLPLLNKALVPSSLASVLLHGTLLAGFSFNIDGELARDEGGIRLHIQLNNPNIMSKLAEESASSVPDKEIQPEVNKAKISHESQSESLPEPVVSNPEPAKEKIVQRDKPPEPSKSESLKEVSVERVPFLEDGSQPGHDFFNEQATVREQTSTALREQGREIDPIQTWLLDLQQRVNRHRRYPKQAIKRGLEGDVRIKAMININGTLISAEVQSGHRAFHSNSLKSLKQALPYPPPTGTSQPITIVFTIHYKLE